MLAAASLFSLCRVPFGPQPSTKFFQTEVDLGYAVATLPFASSRRISGALLTVAGALCRDDQPDGSAPIPARKRLAKVDEARFEFDEGGCTALPASVPLQTVMDNTVDTLPIRSKRIRRQWRRIFQSRVCKDVIQVRCVGAVAPGGAGGAAGVGGQVRTPLNHWCRHCHRTRFGGRSARIAKAAPTLKHRRTCCLTACRRSLPPS